MNDIDRWFDRAARSTRKPVTLYPSFLSGQISAYLRYRLRYPLLIAVIRFVVHVAEFFILLDTLGGVAAFTVMMLRAGSLFISGGWWGLLEVMRERLRAFAATGDREASGHEIGRWLVLAALLAIATTVAAAVILLKLGPSGPDAVTRWYALLIVVEFAIDLPVRVLHSGAFATRRVYKPAWSMLVPILAQLAILGLGFKYYPAAAIIVAIVVSNALSIWITVHYTVEVYRLMGLHPHIGGAGSWRNLPSIPLRLGLETTLSGLSLRLDAILVLALVGFYGTNVRTFDLTAGLLSWKQIDAFQFFYLILPLFRGTYESASIFYFDLVRLRSKPALRELQLVFFRRLLCVAPLVALFFWILAAALGVLVLRDVPASFLIALIPLFVLRSLIGMYQIRLFADGHFGTHIGTFGLLVVMLWLVWLDPRPDGDLLQITAAMIVQLIVLINLQHLSDRRDLATPALVQLPEWKSALAGESGPTVIGTMRMAESLTAKQKSAAVALLRQTFAQTGHFAYLSSTSLLYYERCSDGGGRDRRALLGITGGAISGEDRISPISVQAGCDRAEDLIDRFRSEFPDGIVFDTMTLRGSTEMRSLDPTVLAGTVPAAVSALEEGRDLVEVSGRWFTPVYRRGTLRQILFLPAQPDADHVRRWRHSVRHDG